MAQSYVVASILMVSGSVVVIAGCGHYWVWSLLMVVIAGCVQNGKLHQNQAAPIVAPPLYCSTYKSVSL